MNNLFLSLYPEKNKARQLELITCLTNNSKVFDNIFILTERDGEIDFIPELKNKAEVFRLPTNMRPTIRTYFNCINHVCDENDINVLANADIFFKEQIQDFPKNVCYALTRYDILKDGTEHFLGRRDSQDAWCFRGSVKMPQYVDFHQLPGFDNRLARELLVIGYNIRNPSLTIKCFHLHHGEKSYDGTQRVNRPFHFLPPIELI